MGDRLMRAWRAVRSPATVRGGALAAVAGRGEGQSGAALRRLGRADASGYCGASGWRMRAGCGDGYGGTICPLCSQRVRTEPDAATQHGVEVIQAHCA